MLNTIGYGLMIVVIVGGMIYQTTNYRDNNVD
jgi:hypothetical protein